MLARLAQFAFALYLAFCLNILIPGHTRGQYALCPSACHALRPCCAASSERHHSNDTTPGERERCQLCSFALGLCIPPAPLVAPAPTARLHLAPTVHSSDLPCLDYPLAYDGRAPPLGAC